MKFDLKDLALALFVGDMPLHLRAAARAAAADLRLGGEEDEGGQDAYLSGLDLGLAKAFMEARDDA